MSDLVGNPEDWFSRVAAHVMLLVSLIRSGLMGIIVHLYFCVILKLLYED